MIPDSVSFVVPMYNERENIERTLKALTVIAKTLTSDYEIIVSDDDSSDRSGSIVEKMRGENPRVKLERLYKNTKFGGALRAGIKRAEKDIIIYTDSDLPIDAGDIRGALGVLDSCDIVTVYSKVHKGETVKRKIMSKVYNFLIQFLFRPNIKDINSGFKIYKRKIFENMELASRSPFIDVEIFIKAIKKGFVVKQYPVIFKDRKQGKSYISKPSVVFKTFTDMLRFKFSTK